MSRPLRVLIVEDSADDAKLVVRELRTGGFEVTSKCVENGVEMAQTLKAGEWDLVLSDYTLPQFSAIAALVLARSMHCDVPFIIVSGTITDEMAVETMRAGAHDFVMKSHLARLVPAVERALADADARRQQQRLRRELELEQERFRALVEKSSDGVCVCDASGRIIYGSPSTQRLLGYGPEEFVGRSIFDFLDPDETPPPRERLAALTAEPGAVRTGIMRCRRRDGAWRWLEAVCSNLLEDPAIRGVVVNYRDITERQQTEAQLRKLQRALDQTPVTVLITNTDGTIEYANPSFTATTGYTLEEVRGRNPRILKSGEASPETYRNLWATIKAGRQWRGEFHNRKKNGELFWETATISPVTDANGQITHFIAVKEDITERKRNEERIREQAALLDVTRDAIMVVTLDRTITYWNHGAESVYGWTTAEVIGRKLETVLYRETPADYNTRWKLLLEKGELTAELRHSTKAGREIIVQSRATVMRGPQGEPHAVLVVTTDITESKRLEQQFLRTQRLESLGTLASGVAHDLSNILTPVLISAEMLSPLAQTQEDRETMQLMLDSVKRGAEIARQLLVFGRGSDSPHAIVSVSDVVRSVGKIATQTFPKAIVLSVHMPTDLWFIDGDSTQIHQVLLNLCVNARDAMPNGGRLSLSADNFRPDDGFVHANGGARPGPHVRITVADTGCGISPENLEKIFDPFFTTKPLGQGTGVGLTTVLSIVRNHGGFVTVESKVGVGSSFAVYLPVAAEFRDTAAGAAKPQYARGRGELVLVVDDEENIRLLLRRALTEQNYRVITARDGSQALALAGQHKTELKLALTDVMMPGKSGADTIAGLRRLIPDLPVLVVSGLPGHRADLEKSFAPRFRFLSKPFLTDQVLSLVSELLTPVGGTGTP